MKNILTALRKKLLYGSVISGDNRKVLQQIMEDNRKAAVVWSAAGALFFLISLILAKINEEYASCRYVYLSEIIICVFVLICSLIIAPKNNRLIRLVTITFDLVLLSAGVGIALCKPHVRSVTIYVSVLIVPVAFISDTFSTFVLITANYIVFLLLGKNILDPDIYTWTAANYPLYAAMGILIGHFINKTRFERYVFAESAAKLAEVQTKYAYYDQLTGLNNRRAYSEKFDQLSKEMPENCCVVMADINGLKETNDTCGHNAGDELICGAAECIRQSFEGVGTVYRLGGDEFCAVTAGTKEEAEKCLDKLDRLSAGWKGKIIQSMSVSYGLASNEEFSDIDSMIKAADQRMYEHKRNYYLTSGKDRRH